MILLGCLILDPEAIPRAILQLRPDSFISETNRSVFEAIIGCWGDGEDIDIVSLKSRLGNDFKWVETIAGLVSLTPTAANADYYMAEVANSARRRSHRE